MLTPIAARPDTMRYLDARLVIVVGGPRSGKSTFARMLREFGHATYCTDPLSLVKEPEPEVTYLPEGLSWSEASAYVAEHWFTLPGPACVEGIATVRALRKTLDAYRRHVIADAIIVRCQGQFEDAVTKPGQVSLSKGVDSVWSGIEWAFTDSTIYTTRGVE